MATIYHTAASLDGFVADDQNSLDWLMQFGDNDSGAEFGVFLNSVGALAMGSHTYEWVLAHHVHAPTGPNPWPYTQPSWVFSSRPLPAITGADIHFVQGDVRPVHDAMRQVAGTRHLWVVGGGDLAGQFHDAGLLDEIVVTVTAVTLGAGAPVLPRRIVHPPLTLVSVRQFGTAFAELRYELTRGAAAGDARA